MEWDGDTKDFGILSTIIDDQQLALGIWKIWHIGDPLLCFSQTAGREKTKTIAYQSIKILIVEIEIKVVSDAIGNQWRRTEWWAERSIEIGSSMLMMALSSTSAVWFDQDQETKFELEENVRCMSWLDWNGWSSAMSNR